MNPIKQDNYRIAHLEVTIRVFLFEHKPNSLIYVNKEPAGCVSFLI
jgi:hypothetical protein